jgi:hypothetical protein
MGGKALRNVHTAFWRLAKLLADIDVAFPSDGAGLSKILHFGVGTGRWPICAAVKR